MKKKGFIITLLLVILLSSFYGNKRSVESMQNAVVEDETYIKPTDYTFSDTQYHDTIETISKQPDVFGIPIGTVFKENQFGEKYASLVGNDFTFYKTGSRDEFGPSTYTPTYQDSVYLSKYTQNLKSWKK